MYNKYVKILTLCFEKKKYDNQLCYEKYIQILTKLTELFQNIKFLIWLNEQIVETE